jgi:hypothetical protein
MHINFATENTETQREINKQFSVSAYSDNTCCRRNPEKIESADLYGQVGEKHREKSVNNSVFLRIQ